MSDVAISVIIPALLEQETINDTIASLYAQQFTEGLEIIVVDGDPNRSTLRSVQDARVKKVVSEKGRAVQMNEGASMAKGRVLLFLHADTELPRDGLAQICSVMSTGRYIGGAFDLGIRAPGLCFRVIERVASIRSRLTRLPYGDQALFIERQFFSDIGGFAELPIMEDVELMRRVKRSERGIYIIPSQVSTSARRWQQEGIVYSTLRNWILVGLYLLGISPVRLARFYSHERKTGRRESR